MADVEVRRTFIDLSEVACVAFSTSTDGIRVITVVLKSGYWFLVPRTADSVASLEAFCSHSVRLEGESV